MKMTIEMNLDNACFDGENLSYSISDILAGILDDIEQSPREYIETLERKITDINGNTIGIYKVE